jgi:hypothetical protein
VTDTVPVTTGLDEAANAFAGLLSDDLTVDQSAPPNQAADENEQAPAPNAEGDEAPEPSHETQSDDDAPASEGEPAKDGEEDEEAAADKEGEDTDAAKPETFTVKIDGKEVEVPRDEVINGYQRHADYSRKTAALADERRAFDGVRQEFDTERQAVVQERGQYKQLLTALSQRLEELTPQEPDWQALFATDKNEYLLQRDNWRAYQEQKAAAAAELERINQGEHKEHTTARQKRLVAGQAKLLEWEPKWKDDKVRAEDFRAVADYAVNRLGYSQQELANADDPRALFAVYKAMQLDRLQKQAADVKNKATKKGPTLPAGSASRQATPQTRSKTGAMQRLAKSGSVDDAAAVLSQFDL